MRNTNSNLMNPFSNTSFSTQHSSFGLENNFFTKSINNDILKNKQINTPNILISKQVNIFHKDNYGRRNPNDNNRKNNTMFSKPSKRVHSIYEKNSDILNIIVHVFLDNDRIDFNISVNKKRHIEDLYDKILVQLGEKSKLIQDRKYIFHSGGIRLQNNHTFEEANILNNQEISMNFSLKGIETQKKDIEYLKESQNNFVEQSQNENSNDNVGGSINCISNSNSAQTSKEFKGLVPMNLLPKLTKQNYYIRPSLFEINRMNLQEIQSIPNLVIGNEYGEIQFTTPTDLLEVNIDDILNINFHEIELYSGNVKHERGSKLNKEAICLLKNFDVSELIENEEDLNEAIDLLKRQCNDMNTIFISYDPEKKEFKFKVDHF